MKTRSIYQEEGEQYIIKTEPQIRVIAAACLNLRVISYFIVHLDVSA